MKRTAFNLANETWEENEPIDRSWLRHCLRNASHKERMDWARAQVECFADKSDSKQLIGRAAGMFLRWAEREL